MQLAMIHKHIQVSSGAGLNPLRGTDRHSPQWDSTWVGGRQVEDEDTTLDSSIFMLNAKFVIQALSSMSDCPTSILTSLLRNIRRQALPRTFCIHAFCVKVIVYKVIWVNLVADQSISYRYQVSQSLGSL